MLSLSFHKVLLLLLWPWLPLGTCLESFSLRRWPQTQPSLEVPLDLLQAWGDQLGVTAAALRLQCPS